MSKEVTDLKLVQADPVEANQPESTNPFANLDALRNPQDYEEFMNGEVVTGFAVRTLKEGMHLRVRPGNEYSLLGQYTVTTKRAGTYFVYPQFREALGPLPRRCNLHVAVDGHGEYFLLLIKQQNPGKDENEWYRTARVVAAAATEGWIKVTKLVGDAGWGYIPLPRPVFDEKWPDKSLSDLLNAAFPDRVVNTLSHDLIKDYEARGVTFSRFEEIVLVDFEFNGGEGNRPNVVCLVAYELRSGRRFRLWRDQLGPELPYRVDDRTLFVAYYASAELSCHLALGWPMPRNILDLFIEYRNLTNHSNEAQPAAGLLDALDYFHLDSISLQTKKHWRDIVLRGGPWTAEERAGILDYCETDVEPLEKLLKVFPIANVDHALIHGAYMRADAWMRHWGIPIDQPLFVEMSPRWPELRRALIDDLNARYPVFEGETFKMQRLEQWVVRQGIAFWPRTPTGLLCTDSKTLETIAKRCPAAAEFCLGKVMLNQLKTFDLSVGDDGRNRCMLSAFRSKTGRNQPSNSAFIYGLNAAFRSLIKPEPGRALVYLDFSGQEFAIAAYFSGDKNMIAAYESGDPYSDWARKANAMPAGGNKHTDPQVRAVYKLASLGVLYGMKETTLSSYVGVSFTRARALLHSHKETFPRFWQWSEAAKDAAVARHELQTVYGWRMRVLRGAKPGTLANFPMQANGAEMLRLACCMAVDRGIHIIAPIHDAILVEGPAEDISDIVRDLSRCMTEASRAVLGGPIVRVDSSKPLIFPHRYVDGRDGSIELWATTMKLLNRLKRRTA